MMKRRIQYILLFLLLTTAIQAQRGYEYWLDDNYDSRITGTQSTDNDFALSVDVGTLSPGLHIFNYHAQDVTGSWGTLHRQAFLIDATGSSYEYWIDEDYSHRGTGGLSGPEVSASVDISHLSPGIHVFNYRTLATGGSGALTRHAFLIGTDVSGYEYWYDDNYAKRKVKAGNGGSVALSFDLNEVPAGIHALNIRPRTSDGTVGPATSMLFVNELAVVAYEYWFDDDIAYKVTAKASGKDLQLPISVSHLSGDAHYLNFRAMHADGSWGTLMRKGFVLKSNIIGYDYAFGSDATKHVNVTSTEQLVMQNQKFAIPDPKERAAICDTTTIQIDTVANTAMAIRRDTTDFSIFFRNDEGRVSEVQNSEVAVADTLLRQLPEIPLFGSILVDRVDSSDFRGFYINVPDSDTYVLATTQECRLFFYDDQGKRIDDMPLLINPLKLKAGRYYGIIYHMKGTDDSFAVSYAIENNIVAKPIITHKDNRIAISTTTAKATIHYTMDGTTPDATSTVYTDTITVSRNCIIKAVAVRENYEDSDVDSLIVDWFKVANVEFDQNGHTITLTTQTDSATIHYTLSNSGAGEQIYSAPLTLSADCTIEAYATRDGYTPSDTTSFVFHADGVTCSNPVFARNENVITISTQTENAQIYYTTDGTEPTNQSQLYADSIVVDRNMTIKAIAMRENYYPSQVATYEVDWFRVANVEFVPNGYVISLTTATEGAAIRYTLSNSEAGEQVYSEPLTMTGDCDIMAYATRDGYHNSDTTSFVFKAIDVTVAKPTISTNGNKVGISTTTEQATIYYTMDGSEPTEKSAVYRDSIMVDRNCIIKAIAMRQNWFPSQVDSLNVDPFKVSNVEFVQEGNKVILSTETEAATIYYHMVGDLHSGYDEYRDTLSMIASDVIMAYATRDGYTTSDTTRYEFIYTPVGEAVFDGLVAMVSGELTLDDAFDSTGGRSEAAKTIAAIIWDKSTPVTEDDLRGIDNPNLLVYVNESSLAPESVKNVVVNGRAKSIVLTDAKEGNNNFCCPQAFTAEKITYSRNFQQYTQVGVSRGWEAIALPFEVQTISHEEQGDIAPFGSNASSKHFWLRQLTQQGLAQATKIEANVPYIISMPNDTDTYYKECILAGKVTFSAENVTIPVTEPVTLALADNTIMMVPAFQSIRRSSDVWALNVGQGRSEYFEGSTFERDYREVRPFEAYTVHRGDTPSPRFVPIKVMNGGTTGIEDVRSLMSDGRGENWYDMNGCRLQGRPTQKGIYLYNGRKVVIK